MSTSSAKLLVIDDDRAFRETIVATLRKRDYQVTDAQDGKQGLEAFLADRPDAVLCDLRMPGIDGYQVLRRINELDPDVPVIVISAATVMDDVVAALRAGAIDYLTKPVMDMAVLEHAINRALREARLRRENREYREELEESNNALREKLKELEQDQKAGRQIQLRMLPKTPVRKGPYTFSHCIYPSLYLSGDYIDYFVVGDHHMAFFLADVSGHGASSAFVTVLLKNITAHFRSNLRSAGDRTILSPAVACQRLNQELVATGLGKHLTLIAGLLNMKTNMLRYCVAGHLPAPILVSGGKARYLEGEGPAIGLFDDVKFEDRRMKLPQQFRLSLFSDGVFEIIDRPGLAAKEKHLLNLHTTEGVGLSDIVDKLHLDKLENLPDDIAALCIQRS
jgi:serine phosphatase RsbU (regulator of sigma subunit)